MIVDCTWPDCQDLLPAAIAGTLAPAEQARVTEHLATCGTCRQAAAQWRQVAALAHQADATAARFERAGAPGTWAAIQASLVAESPFEGEHSTVSTNHQQPEELQSTYPAPRTAPAGAKRRAGAPVVAISAVVALVALAAALFTLHGRPTMGSSGAGSGKTPTSQSTTSQANGPTATPAAGPPYPQSQNPSAIVSASNAWQIVGGIDKNGQYQAAINHFDGQTWHQQFSATQAVLLSISMDSADDGWAVGSGNVVNGQYQQPPPTTPLVLHYMHGQWVQVHATANGYDPDGVQMLSANDGWMFGSIANGTALYHYNGNQWNAVPFAPQSPATALVQPAHASSNPNPNTPIITQLQMVSDTTGWGLGLWHGTQVIWHDANGTWTSELPASMNTGYVSIGVNGANDVWVLGSYVPGNAAFGMPAVQPRTALQQPQSASREELHHFDGAGWQTIQLPNSVNNYAVGNFVGDGNWILVYDGSGGVLGLLHFASGTWTLTTLPGMFTAVTGLAQQADGTTLAVALQNAAPGGARLLRYANGTWSQIG